ncbi:MAG: WG repeat-containing protein [Paludibaculum sp.]
MPQYSAVSLQMMLVLAGGWLALPAQELSALHPPLLTIARQGKQGFIDWNLKVVIEPVYASTKIPSEGLIPAVRDEGWIAIDYSGKTILELPKGWCFDSSFHSGLAVVSRNLQQGYRSEFNFVDRHGVLLSTVWFERASPFWQGLAVIRQGGEQRFLTRRGEFVNLGAPAELSNLREGIAWIHRNHRYEAVLANGSRAFETSPVGAGAFYENFAAFSMDGLRWGFLDHSGQVVIQPAFEEARRFSEGLAAVKINGLWGYIDDSGNLRIPPKYRAAKPFMQGLAAVSDGQRYGYISTTGRVQIPFRFREALMFTPAGVAFAVEDENKPVVIRRAGYIDRAGRFVFLNDGGTAGRAGAGIPAVIY